MGFRDSGSDALAAAGTVDPARWPEALIALGALVGVLAGLRWWFGPLVALYRDRNRDRISHQGWRSVHHKLRTPRRYWD